MRINPNFFIHPGVTNGSHAPKSVPNPNMSSFGLLNKKVPKHKLTDKIIFKKQNSLAVHTQGTFVLVILQ